MPPHSKAAESSRIENLGRISRKLFNENSTQPRATMRPQPAPHEPWPASSPAEEERASLEADEFLTRFAEANPLPPHERPRKTSRGRSSPKESNHRETLTMQDSPMVPRIEPETPDQEDLAYPDLANSTSRSSRGGWGENDPIPLELLDKLNRSKSRRSRNSHHSSRRRAESPRDDNAPPPQTFDRISEIASAWGPPVKRRKTDSSPAESSDAEPAEECSHSAAARSFDKSHGDDPPNSLAAHHGTISYWRDEVGNTPVVLSNKKDFVVGIGHDINTFTGKLAESIDYPHSIRDRSDLVLEADQELAWRADNMTSSLNVKQLLYKTERAAELRREIQEQEAARAEILALPKVEPVVWPESQCLLRPAVGKDSRAIAKLLKQERKATPCPQSIDEKEVDFREITNLVDKLRKRKRPFLVAEAIPDTGDLLMERTAWPGGQAATKQWRRYVAWAKENPSPPESSTEPGTIIGFAYINCFAGGLSGKASSHAHRESGQIQLLVHPDHRNRLVGSALLDRLLVCTSIYETSKLDYKWECKEDFGIYDARIAHRKYTRVEIQSFRLPEDGVWPEHQKLMDKFGFVKTATLEKEVRTEEGHQSRWLDVDVWRKDIEGRTSR